MSTTTSSTADAPSSAGAGATSAEDLPLVGDFFLSRDYHTKVFAVGLPSSRIEQPLDCLTSASTDFDLTGQIVWPIARVTAFYIAELGRRGELTGRPCLELGAGCGLTGMVAAHFSPRVVLTDYEPEVLDLLKRNLSHAAKSSEVSVFDISWGSEKDHSALASSTGMEGGWPVLIGADVVYWSASIEPLFASVEKLLSREEGAVFILGYTNRLQSNKEKVEEEATRIGLTWTLVPLTEVVGDPYPEEFNGAQLEKMTMYRFVWAKEKKSQEE